MSRRVTGAQSLIWSLEAAGVEVVFGIPGGAILPAYDPLLASPIRHVLMRHEQGAGHAAQGYAYVTGKAGVCMATSGPGATNLVTPLTDAFMDSVPLVAVTGQVPRAVIGNDAFQEADICGITLPVTKHNYKVMDAEEIPEVVAEAFHIATTGRPGPVLVDLPKDVLQEETAFAWPSAVDLAGYRPTAAPNQKQIRAAAELIASAERPVLYVGGGVLKARAADALAELATAIGAPVVTTLMARGAFPDDHPLCLGMPGMHGSYAAVTAMQRADLLITLCARFDDRVTGNLATFAPHAKIIHIDIDPSSISKNIKVDVPIVGDCRRVLTKLVEAVREELKQEIPPATRDGREQWMKQIAEWKRDFPFRYDWNDDVIKPQYVVQELSNLTHGDAFIVTGVGQHQMWAAQYYRFTHPRRWCTSGGLGTMGYGLPTAMGVQAAHPGKLVVNIDGDGSFQMNSQEMATLFAEKLPVKTVIINNSGHGMVRQWQRIIYKERYCAIDLPGVPDWVRLAEAYGCVGLRVTRPSEVVPALEKMLSTPAPVVLDVCVDKDECVFPMVPAGGANTDMILAPPTREVREKAEKSQTGF